MAKTSKLSLEQQIESLNKTVKWLNEEKERALKDMENARRDRTAEMDKLRREMAELEKARNELKEKTEGDSVKFRAGEAFLTLVEIFYSHGMKTFRRW